MIISCNNDASKWATPLTVDLLKQIEFNEFMLQINPKKFKEIKNKRIPNPLRPKFRNKAQSNIYFLSQRKFTKDKKNLLMKRVKLATLLTTVIVGGYFLSN
tara:strand:- start:480 stop:782 length:303 start_codon:yes stop_codon:yes gene_type:complete